MHTPRVQYTRIDFSRLRNHHRLYIIFADETTVALDKRRRVSVQGRTKVISAGWPHHANLYDSLIEPAHSTAAYRIELTS